MGTYFDRHQVLLQIIGAVIIGAASVTAYAYSTFVTERELDQRAAAMEKNHELMMNEQREYMKLRFDQVQVELKHIRRGD